LVITDSDDDTNVTNSATTVASDGKHGQLTANQIKVKESLKTGSLLILGSLAAGVILYYLSGVLIPLVLAKFFAYILQPILRFLERGKRPCRKVIEDGTFEERCTTNFCSEGRVKPMRNCLLFCYMPRWLSVVFTMLFGLGILALIAFFIALSVENFLTNIDAYKARGEEILDSVVSWIDSQGFISGEDLVSLIDSYVTSFLVSAISSVLSWLSDAALIVLFIIFMLFGTDYVEGGRIRREVDRQIQTYLVIKSILAFIKSVLFGIVLFSLQVQLWLIFTLAAFILDFIPNIGSVIATILPIPFVLLDPAQTQFWFTSALIVILNIIIHSILGNLVEPRLLGTKLEMHPVTVLFSLIFWGFLWGLVGAILAVPLTSILKIWASQVDHPMMKFLVRLLDGNISAERKPRPLMEVKTDDKSASLTTIELKTIRGVEKTV